MYVVLLFLLTLSHENSFAGCCSSVPYSVQPFLPVWGLSDTEWTAQDFTDFVPHYSTLMFIYGPTVSWRARALECPRGLESISTSEWCLLIIPKDYGIGQKLSLIPLVWASLCFGSLAQSLRPATHCQPCLFYQMWHFYTKVLLFFVFPHLLPHTPSLELFTSAKKQVGDLSQVTTQNRESLAAKTY